MNAKQLHCAAAECAEQTKGLSETSLDHHKAVAAAFETTGNDPADFETFKQWVGENRGRIARLEAKKLPSEIAAAKAAAKKGGE